VKYLLYFHFEGEKSSFLPGLEEAEKPFLEFHRATRGKL
jgi:hypothetical protein